MKERNKAVPAVYLVLERDGKILLMRRACSGYFDGYYMFPAGHVEAGELPLAALSREAKEEIGVEIEEKDLKLVHTMYRTGRDQTGDRIDLFYAASKWNGEPKIMEKEKCDDLQWFLKDTLPENLVPCIKVMLEAYSRGENYSEIGKE